jgi:hypothetical protein
MGSSSRGLVAIVVLTMLLALGVSTVNAVAVTAGYRDHDYNAPEVSIPSRDVPQSKTWYTDGTWWGALFDPTGEANYIHRYNASAHTWTNTGVAVDARNSSHADYLWDAATNSLFAVSVSTDSSTGPILVFKLNYTPATDTYSHDPDFGAGGVTVGNGPAETATIAKDSTGQLWVTYDSPVGAPSTDRNIMVNRSTTAEDEWGTAFSIGTAGPQDISAIIAFGGNSVGVMWSDERQVGGQTFFRFRSHADSAGDGTWNAAEIAGAGPGGWSEDHLDLTLPSANSGEILAAVKTNGQQQNHVQVLRRSPTTGVWTANMVAGGSNAVVTVSRPHIVVDATNARVYVFFISPENFGAAEAVIYYKAAPLSTLSFTTSGLGTPYIKEGGVRITDVSLSKHPVTAAMGGILGIASGDSNETYYHGWLPIASTPPPPPPPPPSNPFTDIASSKFKNDIIWIYDHGITAGCSPTLYCPKGLVTRAQMATFLVRALHLPPTSTDFFTDDNSSIHEDRINALAAAGITVGCGGTRFCPEGIVAREQMATFLVRAFNLPPTSTDYFTDDNSSIHEARINALRAADVTRGCTATTFCPKGLVNREQMAAFLHRALVL